MPPAASTGTGATSLTTCGHSTIEPTSPQWPPASPPWAMMMSTPASACLRACDGEPHSAATLRPSSWMCLIMSAGGVPSALAINVTFGCCSATSTCGVAVASVQPSSWNASAPLPSIGTPWSARILRAKSTCSCGTMSCSVLVSSSADRSGVHALVLVGDHDVDAVGVVADVLVDPLQLDLELLGREADGAEHAEAAGLAHRDHDVTAVGEGEDRELDAEVVADGRVHAGSFGGREAN